MKRVFADTSLFFVAAIGRRDVYHDRAVNFMREYDGQVITTDFVLVEFGNYLFRIKDRPFFEPVLQNIQANAQYVILEATRELLKRGINRYVAGPTKSGH
jgi:predicted nucleic acid-binding protein